MHPCISTRTLFMVSLINLIAIHMTGSIWSKCSAPFQWLKVDSSYFPLYNWKRTRAYNHHQAFILAERFVFFERTLKKGASTGKSSKHQTDKSFDERVIKTNIKQHKMPQYVEDYIKPTGQEKLQVKVCLSH